MVDNDKLVIHYSQWFDINSLLVFVSSLNVLFNWARFLAVFKDANHTGPAFRIIDDDTFASNHLLLLMITEPLSTIRDHVEITCQPCFFYAVLFYSSILLLLPYPVFNVVSCVMNM